MSMITDTFIPFSACSEELAATALTGSDTLALDNADQRTFFLVKNANTQNAAVAFKAGNGSLSPLGDAVFSVAGGKTLVIPLSRIGSSRIKILSGAGKGTAQLTCTVDSGGTPANVSVSVISAE